MTKIAVFADVQNIYYTTRQAYSRQFDYRKFWQHVSHKGDIEYAFAYAIDRNDSMQRKFQNALRDIGFTIKLKPFIQRSDGSSKGDWDVGIAIDVLEAAADGINHIILLSGDGDFDMLMDKVIQKYGVYAEVYGVPSLTADSLIASASAYNAIDEHLLKSPAHE